MDDHHAVWLNAHPHRTAEWLAEKLRDGFDVHHLDGNPANNAPHNLLLIEHTDHLRVLHGMISGLGRLAPQKGERKPKGYVSLPRKRRAYLIYKQAREENERLALARMGL